MNKYRAVKTVVDGVTFDSKKEASRYQELKLLERAGEIVELDLQKTFRIEINGCLVCKYKADFCYMDDGVYIVEDTKSEITRKNRVYRLKKKLMKAVYDIDITET